MRTLKTEEPVSHEAKPQVPVLAQTHDEPPFAVVSAVSVVEVVEQVQQVTEHTEITVVPVDEGDRLFAALSKEDQDRRLQMYAPYEAHCRSLLQNSYEEYDKQLLALASASLGVTIGFVKDLVPLTRAICVPMLISAWFAFGLSIVVTLSSFICSRLSINEGLTNAKQYYLKCNQEALTKKQRWSKVTECLNAFSGSSFVIGIILVVSFVSINMIRESHRMPDKPARVEKLEKGVPSPRITEVPPSGIVTGDSQLPSHRVGVPAPQFAPVPGIPQQTQPAPNKPAPANVTPGGNKDGGSK